MEVYECYLRAYTAALLGHVFDLAPGSSLTLYAAAALGASHSKSQLAGGRDELPYDGTEVIRTVDRMLEGVGE